MTPRITTDTDSDSDSDTIRLRPLRASDVLRVSEMEPELFGHQAWTAQTYHEELENPLRRYAAAVAHSPGRGERLVGYAGIALGEDAQVMTVGVAATHRRQGIATQLMRHLLATAARHGSERVLLEVRASDTGAQALYTSAGFQPIARRAGYYGGPDGDAVVMARTLHVDGDSVRRANVLIDPGYLDAELDGAEPPHVLQVHWAALDPERRDPREVFRQGHLPGARFVDMASELSGPPSGDPLSSSLPDPADFERTVRSWGIEAGRPIVVADHHGGMAAARAWWLLRWAGLSDVRVLCGGVPGWVDMDLPLETGDQTPCAEGSVRLPLAHGAAPGMPVADLTNPDDRARVAADGGLIDVRDARAFAGQRSPGNAASHVPGATNLPGHLLVGEDGHIASAAVLRKHFADAGLDIDRADQRWTIQCETGMTAPHTVLALEVLGVRAQLWPGSWTQWLAGSESEVTSDPERGPAS